MPSRGRVSAVGTSRARRLPVGSIALLLMCALGGCALLQPARETVPSQPAAEAAPAPADPPAERIPVAPLAPQAQPAAPQRTVVLLSDDIPEFATIAREIELRADTEHLTVLNLDANPANIQRIKAEARDVDQVIAIGLLAATVGLQIDSKRSVFCQVFNYRDYDLISADSKGVNMLPPFDMQLRHWTELDPGLRSVGIIAGPNQDDLIEEARAAAEQHDIDLAVRIVSSDKEALYTFRLLMPDIQGLWLLPDNRILSPEVVREIMANSARHRKQVVVFGENLLGVGGLMSVTSDPGDVAEQVLARLERVSADGRLAGPAMTPLTKVHVQFNHEVARHLDLAVPQLVISRSDR